MSTGTLELEVAQRTVVADGVVSLVLRDPSGRELPRWEPGAHVDLCLPDVVRQYSLSGDPIERDSYRIAVLREPNGRGGSAYVHDMVGQGDRVGIRGPRNHFPLLEAPAYRFVAGGIGITPILPMIAEVSSRGAKWSLLYGGRQRSSMAFLDELAAYGDSVQVHPQDECGLLDLDGAFAGFEDGLVYACGPEPLLAAVEARCIGWGAGRLQVERFAAKSASANFVDSPFEVFCAASDIRLAVPADITLLDALLLAGVDVNFECREGTCGSCELEVLEGEPDHRDGVLSRLGGADDELIYPCVSRSRGPRLALDV